MPKQSIFLLALLALLALGGAKPAQAAACALTPGKPYKTITSATVYYITPDCQKYALPNEKAYFTYFRSWGEIKQTSARTLLTTPLCSRSWRGCGDARPDAIVRHSPYPDRLGIIF